MTSLRTKWRRYVTSLKARRLIQSDLSVLDGSNVLSLNVPMQRMWCTLVSVHCRAVYQTSFFSVRLLYIVKFFGLPCRIYFNFIVMIIPSFSEQGCWKDCSHKFRKNLQQNKEVLSKFYHNIRWTWTTNPVGKSGPMAQVNSSPFQHLTSVRKRPCPAKYSMLHRDTSKEFFLENFYALKILHIVIQLFNDIVLSAHSKSFEESLV